MIVNGVCISYGIIELSSSYYSVYEESELVIYINRNYGVTGPLAIQYEIYQQTDKTPDEESQRTNCLYNYKTDVDYTNNIFNYLEDKQGTIILNDQETFTTLSLKTFPDMKVTKSKLARIKLTSVFGGAIIGEIDSALIEIFDIYKFQNIEFCKIDFNIKIIFESGIYLLLNTMKFDLTSFEQGGVPRLNRENDIYIIRFYSKILLEKVFILNFLSSNAFSVTVSTINFTSSDYEVDYAACIPGILIKHYTNGLNTIPFWIRNSKSTDITDNNLNLAFFSRKYVFYVRNFSKSQYTVRISFYYMTGNFFNLIINNRQVDILNSIATVTSSFCGVNSNISNTCTKAIYNLNMTVGQDMSEVLVEKTFFGKNSNFKITLTHLSGSLYLNETEFIQYPHAFNCIKLENVSNINLIVVGNK